MSDLQGSLQLNAKKSSNKDASGIDTGLSNQINRLTKADFLVHANANLVSIQDGKKLFPTINGEIINYKLRIWTETSNSSDSVKVHVLPFSLISKVSGNYSDSSAGPINDATSYFGAPLTFRIAPSVELFTKNNDNNKLFLGANCDLRLLTVGDSSTNKIETGWGGYVSAGLTYMGTGYAYEGDEDIDESKRYEGKWSFSTLFYYFKSGGTFNKAVFGNYEKKSLTGIELLLRFKVLNTKDSKFNFLVGASNGFTKGAPNSGNWEFRIGIGN